MQFLHTLQVEALLNKSLQARISTWKSSPSLLKVMRKFIWALLLLPNVQWYAGTNENTIIQVMRKSNIPGLPPVDGVNVQRSTFKKKVADSMVDGNKLNVATLTASLLGHSEHVNATLGLYFQIALVRLHCTWGHSNADFWPKIDEELAELRQAGSGELVTALQIVYEDNIQTYGDPAKSPFKTGAGVGEGSPTWLQHLHSLAPLIQRFSWCQGTKHRRPADFDLPNEEEPNENTDGAPEQLTVERSDVEGDEDAGNTSD
ncbi:hypothetical protein MVEN_02404400 [Mycena venus]|uniref:Uncharacterized protein n=1 Tax=Mycena venus TaxID=2733690 RepID=A0A8H7CEF6_9AGAR|nr:hypothetical protein MVEN_02404400 [Mycena venus]